MNEADMTRPQLASWTRQLIQLINDLRAMGTQADFDLPRITVIGNQSAGKSSLVEAISGINVPRAHGTCTRCPIECRLTSSEQPWQCQVRIRCLDGTGKIIEKNFGPALHEKSQLRDMLQRAQLSVLNPSVHPRYFEELDINSLLAGQRPPGAPSPLAFSGNVVCLDVAGPDLPDLSFIDLPGIISTVDKGEDSGNIDSIKKMVQSHIQGNTLILLAITMRDDMNNQGASHLAQLADPDGSRTIGVLTKPDLIQEGEEISWLNILAGTSGHELAHGYYITKHPSPKELEEKVSHDEAREREVRFFETTLPWSAKTELRSRMGTPNLTRKLSVLLGTLISKSIPNLRKEAEKSLAEVKQSLDRLPPPPPADPSVALTGMVHDFDVGVEALIKGSEGFERLLQKCRPIHQQLKSTILSTAPNFQPFESEQTDTKAFKFKVDNEDVDFPADRKPVYLKDVKLHVESFLTRQLPFNTPFGAKVDLIKSCLVEWEAHCMRCLNGIYEATRDELRALVHDHFGRFSGTRLLADVQMACDDLVEKHRAKAVDLIKFQLDLERSPFTLNLHYLSTCREEYLALYKDARRPSGVVVDEAAVREALASLARNGYNVTAKDLPKLHKEDRYEEELAVMAETSAYFCVAYKRIIDNIPRVIDCGFLQEIGKELHGTLTAGLSLTGEGGVGRADRYLAEDSQVKAERTHLAQKMERLEAALKELRRFHLLIDPSHGATTAPTHTVATNKDRPETPPLSCPLPPSTGEPNTPPALLAVDSMHFRPAPDASAVSERDRMLFPLQERRPETLFTPQVRPLTYNTLQLLRLGSLDPPYTPHYEHEYNAMVAYQSISCMPPYRDISFEELRVKDYDQNRKTCPQVELTPPREHSQGLFLKNLPSKPSQSTHSGKRRQ